ncbi:carotenoid biosynthesis protein [Nocardia cyriacigeorgica]|uniref:carotenoid biosynthesis protein n=1 Tax=Nocardia cyriacigeorgica TaxID=135487 RepID=UPI00245637A6|nr:carotenoid biosynthesis protein [Nocardia cyriacigeorgica]
MSDAGRGGFAVAVLARRPAAGALVPGLLAVLWVLSQIAYPLTGGTARDRVTVLVVVLAWTGGVYPIWVVAGLLTRRTWWRVPVTAAGALGWDLFLDPQMVADGQWQWCVTDAGLPGVEHIPLTNYLGWLLVATVMAVLLTGWERTAPWRRGGNAVPVAVFGWTWLGSALAHAVFLDLPASAWYGAAGMGLLGVPLLVRWVRERGAATASRGSR